MRKLPPIRENDFDKFREINAIRAERKKENENKPTVPCKYCGTKGYHWEERGGKSYLCTITGTIHHCKSYLTNKILHQIFDKTLKV